MSENRVSEWYDENAERLKRRARRIKEVRTADEEEDLVQDVVVKMLEAELAGNIKEEGKLENYGNAILTNLIANRFRRVSKPNPSATEQSELCNIPPVGPGPRHSGKWRTVTDQGELCNIPERATDEEDLDVLLTQADPMSVAAAMIDVATPTRRKTMLSALIHWESHDELEQALGVTPKHLRVTAGRLHSWLATTFKNSFRDSEHLFSRIRPPLDLVIERYIRILNDHSPLIGLPDEGLDAALRECRAVVADAATQLGVVPRSVRLFVDVLRYVSPLPQDLSAGRVSFILAEDRDDDRFQDPAIQGALDAFRDAADLTQDGDIAGTVSCLARAWRRAVAFEPCDLVEQLAMRLLRHKALGGVVWRVANGGVREEDLAPLMS